MPRTVRVGYDETREAGRATAANGGQRGWITREEGPKR
jgi:hypothetical protein